MQLGMRTCFVFLATSLHIACLGLWEYLQGCAQHKATSEQYTDVDRVEKGLENALWMIEHMAQGADNAAIPSLLMAVRRMRTAFQVASGEPGAPPQMRAPSPVSFRQTHFLLLCCD